MSGALRLNGVTGKYDFFFTDAVDFDTETNQTQTDFSPGQLTIKIGDKTYTQPNPGGGVSGFHVLILYAETLEPLATQVVTTNDADGAERPADVQQLANQLTRVADNPARPLVFLPAFGAPHGNDGAWNQAAQQIERLGGTRQVFNAMNAVDPQALNGEDPNRTGPYAFVGRVGSTAPLAEASYSLNGLPGRLAGVLMRARDGEYEPMLAAPPSPDGKTPVNIELIHIANQAPQPFPAFKDANGRPIDAVTGAHRTPYPMSTGQVSFDVLSIHARTIRSVQIVDETGRSSVFAARCRLIAAIGLGDASLLWRKQRRRAAVAFSG